MTIEEAAAALGVDLKLLRSASPEVRREVEGLLATYADDAAIKQAGAGFIDYARYIWPAVVGETFVEGAHHRKLAEALEDVVAGRCDRLMICLPPRHTKSTFVSKIFPSFWFGRFPSAYIMLATHNKSLATGYSRAVRDTLRSDEYARVFPETRIMPGSTNVERWNTDKLGELFAGATGVSLTGRGANLLLIDDPHSEQDAVQARANPRIYDQAYDWYRSGPRQRLQPGGSIILVMTRWSRRDLVGQILEHEGSRWRLLEFPAILPSGTPLWPEYWKREALEDVRDSIGSLRWMAQYQQNPVAVENALVKPADWIEWKGGIPRCSRIVQSWDTAFESTANADYSACTTWGVTTTVGPDGRDRPVIVLLHAWRGKVEFPELKRRVKDLYHEWKPHNLVVERKASGASLVQELRTTGVPVRETVPSRGDTKMSRVLATTDMFASGFIYYLPTAANHEVVAEFADFPNGTNDDLVDSSTQALALLKGEIFEARRALHEADEQDSNARMRSVRRRYY